MRASSTERRKRELQSASTKDAINKAKLRPPRGPQWAGKALSQKSPHCHSASGPEGDGDCVETKTSPAGAALSSRASVQRRGGKAKSSRAFETRAAKPSLSDALPPLDNSPQRIAQKASEAS